MWKFDQNPLGGICSTGIRSPILSILDLNRDGSRGGGERAVHSPENDDKDDEDENEDAADDGDVEDDDSEW